MTKFIPPRSAFFIFCSEFRPKVKSESPGLSIGDVAKKLGEMWNSTATEDKQPYEKTAAKLKEKYKKVRNLAHFLILCCPQTELHWELRLTPHSSITGHCCVSQGQNRRRSSRKSPCQGREEGRRRRWWRRRWGGRGRWRRRWWRVNNKWQIYV